MFSLIGNVIKNASYRMQAASVIPNQAALAISPSFQGNILSNYQQINHFHARDSKVKYLDFRHRFKTNHLRLNMVIIRKQKMKKHHKIKWRKKFKSFLESQRLYREIVKEKAFRVELLSMIREAENFDPKQYVLDRIAEQDEKSKVKSKEERFEEIKELIRQNRKETFYVKPKHIKADLD